MALRKCCLVIIFASSTLSFHTRIANELDAPQVHNARIIRENETEIASPVDLPEINRKVKIEVYYETLCPASVDFFTSQLRPVVERLASYVDVRLVPYGHAKTWWQNGRYRFRCQHGPAECYGNRLQACVVQLERNATRAALLAACLMQHTSYRYDTGMYDYFTAFNWCSYKLSTYITSVWNCVNSERGSVLLKGHGEATHELRPRYVPYVILDGSTEGQSQATGNLMAVVCHKLPASIEACQGYDVSIR